MKRDIRNSIIRDLVAKGFKRAKTYPFLYLNKSGVVYGLNRGEILKPDSRNYIFAESKRLNLPKLVLATFGNQPIRNGQIEYVDGNKRNLNVDNLKYSSRLSTVQLERIDKDSLSEAIRCYFHVSKRYNVRNAVLTRVYLTHIVEKRGLLGKENTRLIESYLSGLNVKECSLKFNLTVRDCRAIINDFINNLSKEVITDKQNGVLSELGYLERSKSKRQILKSWNDYKKSFSTEK
ncbi:hypothetical protein CYCD_26690 [Tenuifilaceae bacterium CYCD]|nr:hypothetical protein CYCD_26690 [Tenuifilaceae bacterium CYCD]